MGDEAAVPELTGAMMSTAKQPVLWRTGIQAVSGWGWDVHAATEMQQDWNREKVRVCVREKSWTQGKTARERLSAALTFPTAVPIWSLFCTPLSAGRTQGTVMLSPTPFFHQKLWFPIRFLLMGTDGDRRGGEEGRERRKPETRSRGRESKWVGIKWKVFKSRRNGEKKSKKVAKRELASARGGRERKVKINRVGRPHIAYIGGKNMRCGTLPVSVPSIKGIVYTQSVHLILTFHSWQADCEVKIHAA